MSVHRAGFPILLCLVGAVAPGASVTAQEDPTLLTVERLTAEGRIMEARDSLAAWLDLYEFSASRANEERAIWLRALLTVDPAMAEVDLRRLVLEYPGGAYSGRALFRLGLAAEARGDLRGARSSLEGLIRAYPPGPDRSRAEAWMAAHGFEVPEFGSVAGPPGRDRSRGTPTRVEGEAEAEFSVQVGAFSSMEGALALAAALTEEGFTPRLVKVPGPDLTRVRVGRFSSREGAEEQARLLRAAGFDVTLVFDAMREEPVG